MVSPAEIERVFESEGAEPRVVRAPLAGPRPIIGLGAELKATVCYLSGSTAWISESFGDLRNGSAYRSYRETLNALTRLTGPNAPTLAHDMHPAYVSSELARAAGENHVAVQHHHAHAVSSAVGAGLTGPMIAVVCDGTGYGSDGASWGGEVLYCEGGRYERLARLRYCALPGGDASSVETWRPAVSLLRDAFGESWREMDLPLQRHLDESTLRLVEQMLRRDVNCPRSSSLGRLFDAVAAITGLCLENSKPAEAAITLQLAAEEYLDHPDGNHRSARDDEGISPYAYRIDRTGETTEIDPRETVRQIVADVTSDRDPSWIAARFHETVCAAFAEAIADAAKAQGVRKVVMSGGCFLNPILVAGLDDRLSRRKLHPVRPSSVSVGDDGISLGQAVVAAQRLRSPEPCA